MGITYVDKSLLNSDSNVRIILIDLSYIRRYTRFLRKYDWEFRQSTLHLASPCSSSIYYVAAPITECIILTLVNLL